ncbi:MAG: hypothetical protein ACK4IS_13400 [Erythrobacter sp.]
MLSVVLIVPADLRDDANKLAELLGHGPNNYSVPLSADGAEPATHYGLHTWAEQSFIELLAADGMPKGLEQFAPVKDAVLVSVRDEMGSHFWDVLNDKGLAVMEPPE